MDYLMIASTLLFCISVFLVITGYIDTVIAAFLGVVAMIVFGVMTDKDAFQAVDWNVIFILIGIWIIATYLGKTGLPEYLAAKILLSSKGNVALFVTLIGGLSPDGRLSSNHPPDTAAAHRRGGGHWFGRGEEEARARAGTGV